MKRKPQSYPRNFFFTGFDELSILPNAKCYELEMKRYFTLQRFYRPVLVFELLEMDCPLEQFYAESQTNTKPIRQNPLEEILGRLCEPCIL